MQKDFQEPAIWVEQQADVERMLADLSRHAQIAIDTESNSLYAYQEQVCLIQISTRAQDYLVDPLAAIDLSGFGAITRDADIEKIFHAAEYDIICLRRDFGFEFQNIFDTMHTARVLGFEKIGLADMLKNQFGVTQGRSYQKANWGKRPLEEGMRTYARYDTHFLIPLREQLGAQLENNFLGALVLEDFNNLSQSHANGNHQPLYAAVSGYHKLSGRELRVLDELCQWRDRTARQLDRPHFKVTGNKALLAAAQSQPATIADLVSIAGISERMTARFGADILAAIRKGLGQAPLTLPKRNRPSRAYIQRLEELGKWRKKAAREFKVQSDIILPRSTMEDIAGSAPRDLAALQSVMAAVPWRFEHFGNRIMAVLRKGN